MSKPQDVVNFRIRVKTALVESFGCKCQLCGKTYPQSVFEFHHLIPEEKSFALGNSSTTRAKSAYAEEAKKCAMLCANCHRLVEYEDIDTSQLYCIFDEEKYYQVLDELTNRNKKIQEEIKKEKPYRPNVEELQKAIYDNNGNFTAVGRIYGVTGNSISKWCKKFNIPYHASDYKPQNEIIIKEPKEKYRIRMLDKVTLENLQEFDTMKDAENFLNIPKAGSHICKVCNGERKTAYGYKWEYIK